MLPMKTSVCLSPWNAGIIDDDKSHQALILISGNESFSGRVEKLSQCRGSEYEQR